MLKLSLSLMLHVLRNIDVKHVKLILWSVMLGYVNKNSKKQLVSCGEVFLSRCTIQETFTFPVSADG